MAGLLFLIFISLFIGCGTSPLQQQPKPPATNAGSAQAAVPLDQYGGTTLAACPNTTGHFTLAKVNNHWWFCTPDGHPFFAISTNFTPNGNPTYDCAGNNTSQIYLDKYGDRDFNLGWQTEVRMRAWGFNAVAQDSWPQIFPITKCNNCVWPGGVNPIPFPLIMEDRPISYSSVNLWGYANGPVKSIMWGVNSSYKAWRSWVPDVFDNNLHQWWQTDLQNNPSLAVIRNNSPWLLGIYTDDSDYFWGSGAGPDFSSGGHTNANLGWITLISSPVQTYQQATQNQKKQLIYTDTMVYSKASATNPGTACSVSNPCSLRDFLWQKYNGSIAALNNSWGSNYTSFDSTGTQVTGETIATGDGSTTTFSYTLAHAPVSPHSLLISVAGTAQAGDCPWFHTSPNCNDATANTGSIASPTANFMNQSASSINYSTGVVTLSFAAAPAKGVAITANYIYGGWMAGGTGLMDESGSNAWVGTNPFCVEGADPNYSADFACKGLKGGASEPAPNANANLGADLDTWVAQISARYFKTMHDDLRAVSQIPYLGLDTIGSWWAPANSNFLQGAAPYIDGAQVILRSDLPNSAAFQAAYQYTTRYLGDVPLINFVTNVAESDSSMSCHPNNGYGMLPNQAARGQRWFDTMNYVLNHPGYNGTYPFVSFDWWAWQDFQGLNQGLVSIHDNAYDGKEAMMGSQPCGPETAAPGYRCGGEAANYGDAVTPTKQGNALWLNIASQLSATPSQVVQQPTPTPAPDPVLPPARGSELP